MRLLTAAFSRRTGSCRRCRNQINAGGFLSRYWFHRHRQRRPRREVISEPDHARGVDDVRARHYAGAPRPQLAVGPRLVLVVVLSSRAQFVVSVLATAPDSTYSTRILVELVYTNKYGMLYEDVVVGPHKGGCVLRNVLLSGLAAAP